jgi:ubiquinone/menaquinone biosynthesis C-methylase UbiE
MTDGPVAVARYFDRHARAYDRRYDQRLRQRLLWPALPRLRERAVALVRERPGARVLDVGCGSGRVAEAVLEAGAGDYVGIDVSTEMLTLARRRLDRLDGRVTLVGGAFGDVPLAGRFDVVLALGLFDYVPDPATALQRMVVVSSGVALATFPRWNPRRDRVRRVVYGCGYGCSLQHFDRRRLDGVLAAAGVADADVVESRTGFRVTWRADSA